MREMEQAILLATNIEQLTLLMRALGPGPDQSSHQLADAILMRAIQILASNYPDMDTAALLHAFDSLEKWYA